MMRRTDIEKYEGTLKELAEDIGNLRYDALTDFLRLLSEKIKSDAIKDQARKRQKLANCLDTCAEKLQKASADINEAWKICEPYMK
ncbi:MAG: hypothetical protein U0401_09555 [Anaerolineae bacterium]